MARGPIFCFMGEIMKIVKLVAFVLVTSLLLCACMDENNDGTEPDGNVATESNRNINLQDLKK